MTFPYKLIDLTHTLDDTIPTWNGGCGFNHDVHIDYSDCEGEYKFRVIKCMLKSALIWTRQSIVLLVKNEFMILM